MRGYLNGDPRLLHVALRREVSDALRQVPEFQRAGLGARNQEAERIVAAVLSAQQQERGQ